MLISKNAVAALSAALAILSTTLPAGAALNASLSLKGQKQGVIKGGSRQLGREGTITVFAVSHGVASPHSHGGVPSGPRMPKPLVITKELDQASPLLLSALVSNENIVELTLHFYGQQPASVTGVGKEMQIYSIKLTNAHLVGIDFKLPNNRNPEEAKLPQYEEVSFVYDKIEWTWTQGGVTTIDEGFNR